MILPQGLRWTSGTLTTTWICGLLFQNARPSWAAGVASHHQTLPVAHSITMNRWLVVRQRRPRGQRMVQRHACWRVRVKPRVVPTPVVTGACSEAGAYPGPNNALEPTAPRAVGASSPSAVARRLTAGVRLLSLYNKVQTPALKSSIIIQMNRDVSKRSGPWKPQTQVAQNPPSISKRALSVI